MEEQFKAAFADPDGVWMWIGDSRADEREVRKRTTFVEFTFRWKLRKAVRQPCFEVIFDHELLDESAAHADVEPGPIQAEYTIWKDGRGEGW